MSDAALAELRQRLHDHLWVRLEVESTIERVLEGFTCSPARRAVLVDAGRCAAALWGPVSILRSALVWYRLDEDLEPVPDPLGIEQFMCAADRDLWRARRRVARTRFGDGSEVSTVFLGMDYLRDGHSFFETALFERTGEVRSLGRSRSWHEAEFRHDRVVEDLEHRGRAPAAAE